MDCHATPAAPSMRFSERLRAPRHDLPPSLGRQELPILLRCLAIHGAQIVVEEHGVGGIKCSQLPGPWSCHPALGGMILHHFSASPAVTISR